MNARKPLAVLLALGLLALSHAQEATSVIKEILVRGNERVNQEVILGVMRTQVGQPYIQDNLDRDQRAIEDLGFFSAVSLTPTPLEGGAYRITVDVKEFPIIREIRVVGNSAVSTEEILKVLTLKVGQVFNQNAVRPSADAVQAEYERRGFFGLVSDLAPLADSPGTLNVQIQEIKVGTVSVQGNVRTKGWVFARLIKTRPGEAFSGDKWGRDLRRIAGTGWFEPGTIRSQEDLEREEGKVDLTVQLREAKTGNFNVGVQVDPRSSIAGFVRLSETNLGGTGQTVGVDYLQTTAGGGASVGLDYLNPFFRRTDTALQASLYSRIQYRFTGIFGGSGLTNADAYNERRTGGSLGLTRPQGENRSTSVNLRAENVRTNNIPDTAQPESFIRQDGTVGALALGFQEDRRDLRTDPAFGDLLNLSLEPGIARIDEVGGAIADQSVLGTHPFVKGSVEYRRYFTREPRRTRQNIDAPRRVLALRTRFSTVTGTIPFFEQYFAGGSDSIRGYDEDRFWGKNLFVTNLEYRYPIQQNFSAIGFVDYGGAWGGYGTVNNFTQSRDFKLHLGYGVGLSFRSPLGPIRIDLGFNEDGRSRTHFLIGTSF